MSTVPLPEAGKEVKLKLIEGGGAERIWYEGLSAEAAFWAPMVEHLAASIDEDAAAAPYIEILDYLVDRTDSDAGDAICEIIECMVNHPSEQIHQLASAYSPAAIERCDSDQAFRICRRLFDDETVLLQSYKLIVDNRGSIPKSNISEANKALRTKVWEMHERAFDMFEEAFGHPSQHRNKLGL